MELIGIPEAAEILGVRRETVWDWVDQDKLKPVGRIGSGERYKKRAVFDRAQIEKLAAQRAQTEFDKAS